MESQEVLWGQIMAGLVGHDEAWDLNLSVEKLLSGFNTVAEFKIIIMCMPKEESSAFRCSQC